MLFRNDAEKEFNAKVITYPGMDATVSHCANIYYGIPEWVSREDDICTINFAKTICSEIARLTALDIGIEFEGEGRGEWLQGQVDSSYFNLRHWIEYGMAFGTAIIKPNGDGLDVFVPGQFEITSVNTRNEIDGAIFKDTYEDGGKYYTRLEYHRFAGKQYVISNKAYISENADDKGKPIALEKTKWGGLLPEVCIEKANGEPLDNPLFGVLRTPQASNVELNCPLGLPIFQEAIQELKDLDIAYSRNALEIKNSKKIVLADDRLMYNAGKKITDRIIGKSDIKLPSFVKNVFGHDEKEFYQEINPELQTTVRREGINQQLSLIGYKCGFDNGYFKFDDKTGLVTATQVEAEQQRTIQLIKDCRDKLESCLNDTIYALSVMADLYNLSPSGPYKVNYSFGDICYNYEEDKQTWWRYVTLNKIPAWYYFVKFEKMTEKEAKALVEEAEPKEGIYSKFGEE